jgi:uncharacterized protein (TIGR02611 family)
MSPRLHSPSAWMRWISSNVKRMAVFAAGVALLAVGAALLVLPGPGLLVIFAGLAVLATEFAWAERALDSAKARTKSATGKLRRSRTANDADKPAEVTS